MKKSPFDLTIVFKERDRVMDQENLFLSVEEIAEFDEINVLREIVLDVKSPKNTYHTTT